MELKKYIDEHFNDTLNSIIKIIQIRTVKGVATDDAPYGIELKKGLNEVLEIAKSLGFKVKKLNNYVGYAEYGEGEEYIAVLGHIDVVPEGDYENWSVPPYAGTIVDNELIARGSIDNKGPIISALYALKAVVDTESNFNKRVRIIFGTNEESGDEDIKYYLSKEQPPKYAFTPDGRFPVIFSEKGIYTFSFRKKIDLSKSKVVELKSGTRSNIVPETAILKVKNISQELLKDAIAKVESYSHSRFELDGDIVKCIGKSAHASSPQKGVNALLGIYQLLDLILNENDSLKEFVTFIAKKVGESYDGANLGIKTVNTEVGDLTISAGITNIINDEIFVKFNIRYPNTIDEKTLDSTLDKVGKSGNVVFFKENHNPPLYFEKTSPLVKELQEVYHEVTGRDEEPAALGGGTYAKLMPNTVAFGPNFKEYKGNAHSFDESINLDMLKQGMEIYAKAILRLSKLVK